MGRWLSALRAREFSESAQPGTAKTDKTSPNGVLSVLAVPVLSISEKSAGGFVGFVSAPCEHFKNSWPSLTKEDWQTYFDERAAVREFDGEMPRDDAEALALQDTIAALGPRPLSNKRGLA
jgi:hypothetical protein